MKALAAIKKIIGFLVDNKKVIIGVLSVIAPAVGIGSYQAGKAECSGPSYMVNRDIPDPDPTPIGAQKVIIREEKILDKKFRDDVLRRLGVLETDQVWLKQRH